MKHSIRCGEGGILARSVTDMLANIAHFPKTLAGQIKPLAFSN